VQYKLPKDFGISLYSSEVGDGPMNLSDNKYLKKFYAKIALPTPLSQAQQVHGNNISKAISGEVQKDADGLFAFDSTPLSVRSADCAPVFLFDKETGFFCAIHCGRKSVLLGIISVTLKNLLSKNSIDHESIKVFIGPHIRVNSYPILKKDVESILKSSHAQYIKDCGEERCFDLTGAIYGELENIGIKENNIIDCKINTFTDERFYSYRRSGGGVPMVFVTVGVKNGT
jgi:copper oxidase (laccase) domain-containing protein